MKFFSPGQVIKIHVDDDTFTSEGYSTCDITTDRFMKLYEKIDLSSFPGWNDYTGESYLIKENSSGLILSMIGRPDRISEKGEWWRYDVYEVYINNRILNVFAHNIKE